MYLCNEDKVIQPINNQYSGKFKEEVLEYYYNHNMLLRETAAYFNIPTTSTISNWAAIYEKDGVSCLYEERRGRKFKKQSTKQLYVPSQPAKDIKDLSYEEAIKELEYLRMENEVLKKYHAFWTDMYETILNILFNIDEKKFYDIVNSAEDEYGLKPYISNDKNSLREYIEITNGLFIEKNTSTHRKIIILKKLFDVYDIQYTDLDFCIR